jgi:hypothetical protein
MATKLNRDSTAAKPGSAREKEVPAHLEVGDDGWTVIVPDLPIAPLTVEQTRAAIDLGRR